MKKIRSLAALLAILFLCSAVSPGIRAAAGYQDVPGNAWYLTELEYCTAHHMVNGTSAITFSPNESMTRAQFITIIGRTIDGAAPSTGKFQDVRESQYYIPYLYWGVENGIIYGTSATTFSPDAPISRQDMATIVGRTVEAMQLTLPLSNQPAAAFADTASIAGYARGSVDLLRKTGILKGNPNGCFYPNASMTRAEGMATVARIWIALETGTPPEPVPMPDHKAPPLHVSGTRLVNESGQTVQLRGVSTHGLAWFPQYVSENTFRTLRDDWGANVVRLAMYTAEYGGYCSGGGRAALKKRIDDGVQAASRLGMYVIIDWHILSDGNPTTHQAEAEAFFRELSAKYAGYGNVLYEICNEPTNSPWGSVIKPYAERILTAIRANDPDAIVIVGTNTWSQDVDQVIGSRLADPNVVYAFHFYAATHQANMRNKLTKALDAGIPVFVSECGVCEASGNGNIDTASAQSWLQLLNSRSVSFLAWGLCNKNESAALLRPDCSKTYGWTESDLSASGRWFRTAIRGS